MITGTSRTPSHYAAALDAGKPELRFRVLTKYANGALLPGTDSASAFINSIGVGQQASAAAESVQSAVRRLIPESQIKRGEPLDEQKKYVLPRISGKPDEARRVELEAGEPSQSAELTYVRDTLASIPDSENVALTRAQYDTVSGLLPAYGQNVPYDDDARTVPMRLHIQHTKGDSKNMLQVRLASNASLHVIRVIQQLLAEEAHAVAPPQSYTHVQAFSDDFEQFQQNSSRPAAVYSMHVGTEPHPRTGESPAQGGYTGSHKIHFDYSVDAERKIALGLVTLQQSNA